MKLLKLNLKNFKGIKKLELNPGGKDIDIFGDNATGKTTIADAFNWLLFGKDSQNKADFEIKTLDEDNSVIHGLEHEVEGFLEVEGKELVLKKIYKEKWTKSKGEAQAKFTGHTTDHFIDEVPVKKTEYENKISEIADEGVFKLLTSPTYFNEEVHWQDRRNTLIEICGDLDNKDIISAKPELAKLADILKERTIDEHKKVIAASRSKINEELKKIPTRVDEVNLGLPDIKNINGAVLAAERDNLEKTKEVKAGELSRIVAGGEIAEKTKAIRTIESELIEIKNNYQADASELLENKQSKIRNLKNNIANFKDLVARETERKNAKSLRSEGLESKNKELRDQWTLVNDSQLVYEADDVCPTCGQELPKEKREDARNKALKEFNTKKASDLKNITEEGKLNKESIENYKKEIAEIDADIKSKNDELNINNDKLSSLELEINDLESKIKDVVNDPKYLSKIKNKEVLQKEIEDLQKDKTKVIDSIKLDIKEIDAAMAKVDEKELFLNHYKKGQERIEELKKEERKLASEFEKLEQELYLIEQFTIAKVGLLEEKINKKFKMAKFKLFNTLVNGGVEETCETLHLGVPYNSLNNAARINTGLDIINTLAEHYGVDMPIFIDNREAVTELIKTNGQVISLIVSKKDETLRIEKGDE